MQKQQSIVSIINDVYYLKILLWKVSIVDTLSINVMFIQVCVCALYMYIHVLYMLCMYTFEGK